ncbi:MAG: hypothetical protein EPN41_14450 [Candidimonas sp.]|nr:MAG: hypothetical protein EPN41_14450 [Candidimonas sp.]
MYFDRLGGRALEVEALTGAIVSRGKQLGVATPLNGMLLSLLRAVSDGATGGGANDACGVQMIHTSFSSR